MRRFNAIEIEFGLLLAAALFLLANAFAAAIDAIA